MWHDVEEPRDAASEEQCCLSDKGVGQQVTSMYLYTYQTLTSLDQRVCAYLPSTLPQLHAPMNAGENLAS